MRGNEWLMLACTPDLHFLSSVSRCNQRRPPSCYSNPHRSKRMRYGYFDDEHREYVIERPDVPVSWTNYLGVKDLCTVISHNAGGYSFYKSAEHHRLTRFRQNGVPLERPGHYVYVRDDDTGEYWSISWQPTGKDLSKAKYQCRHGLSYSIFSCDYQGIQASQLVFIPVQDDVEL